MTNRCGKLAVVLFSLFLAGLTGCNRTEVQGTQQSASNRPPAGVVVAVQLQLNADGSCTQLVNGASTPYILLNYGDQVTWAPSNAVGFYIQFPGASPFYNSYGNPTGTSVTSTSAVGPSGTTYSYSNITINGTSCNNPGAMGLRMR